MANNWEDGFDAIELVILLEEEFDIEIYEELVEEMDTVSKIIEYIFIENKS